MFSRDEGFEMFVEGGEVWMRGDRVERGMVALVTLVFPDVDLSYPSISSMLTQRPKSRKEMS